MPPLDLRIVKLTPIAIAIGICEYCNSQFSSSQPIEDDAESEIRKQFNTHKCKPLDASQDAVRIEGK